MFAAVTALLLIAAAPDAAPQVPQIAVGTRLERFDKLKPGINTYIRYRDIGGILRPVDLWRREVRFDMQGGRRLLHIVQSWTGPTAAPSTLKLDSWFEDGSFKPISHERRRTLAEETKNEGFLFAPSRVEALPGTPENSRSGFVQETPQPVFNFETDMETLEALPLAPGYAARLRFYHPGGPPPADYTFRVVGSTALAQPDGKTVDCWLVTLDSVEASAGRPSRFFVAKDSQKVLRVEQPQPDGSMIVKVLLGWQPA